MDKFTTTFCSLSAILAAITMTGCGAISVSINCPSEIELGETITLAANVVNPGAIARYQWEAIPASSGTFADPESPNTTFQANEEGEVTLRLASADGLFTSTAFCQTMVVTGTAVAVELNVAPTSGEVGDLFTLGCLSSGSVPAVLFSLQQVSGPQTPLTNIIAGIATFTPEEAGDYTFRCFASDIAGNQSEAQELTVTVTTGGRRPGRR